MKEGKIKIISAPSGIDQKFLEKEYFTRDDIRTIAKTIGEHVMHAIGSEHAPKAPSKMPRVLRGVFDFLFKQLERLKKKDDISKDEFTSLIVDVFSPAKIGALYQYLNDSDLFGRDEHQLMLDEFEIFLRPVRVAIVEELEHIISPEVMKRVSLALHFYGKHSQAREVSGEKFFKEAPEWERLGDAGEQLDQIFRIRALRTLYELRRKKVLSPYVALPNLKIDPDSGAVLQQKLHFTTLDILLDATPPPSLHVSLRYVLHAMLGEQFLLDHGLLVTDVSLDNIGVDQTTHTGFLFDFDALRSLGDADTGYAAKDFYRPPIYRSEVPSSADVVYEFGSGLCLLLENYSDVPPELRDCSSKMMEYAPENRPPLSEAIATLQRMLI